MEGPKERQHRAWGVSSRLPSLDLHPSPERAAADRWRWSAAALSGLLKSLGTSFPGADAPGSMLSALRAWKKSAASSLPYVTSSVTGILFRIDGEILASSGKRLVPSPHTERGFLHKHPRRGAVIFAECFLVVRVFWVGDQRESVTTTFSCESVELDQSVRVEILHRT